ncbi:hypothetical protein [Duganella vulcania]|uniref:Uncharacterized protein n=1 Tax=Duganella vulcania TaxID=2692166 RepID=A0A845GH95_9BURK|nr:hypothetical protein [Duganella vulcania]MYM92666.1 hypothetical protein [Duganella vulcania]
MQLNDARQISEMQLAPQMGYGQLELPFLFFQRVLPDGRLELRSPGGYQTYASPADVCDVIPGTMLKVRAMPRQVFLARLALPHNEIGKPPGVECYASASVLYVEKDRWGRVDRTFVWFDDDELNDAEAAWPGPIHPDDRAAVASQARRACMPVVTPKGGASYSASQGTAASASNAAYAARRFFEAAMQGSDVLVSALAGIGASKSATPASINRLLYKLGD